MIWEFDWLLVVLLGVQVGHGSYANYILYALVTKSARQNYEITGRRSTGDC